MKRRTIWLVAGLVVVFLAVAFARASFRRSHGWCGHGWRHRGPLGLFMHELKLNDGQISQIQSMWSEERGRVAPLLKTLVGGAHQLVDANVDGKLDENKVQAIATAEGNAFAQLLIEKERFLSRVSKTVLSGEQRQSARKIQEHWLERMDQTVERLDQPHR